MSAPATALSIAAWIVLHGPSVGDDDGDGAATAHDHESLPDAALTYASVSGPGATVVVVVVVGVAVVVALTVAPDAVSFEMKTSLPPLEAIADVAELGSKSTVPLNVPATRTSPAELSAMPTGAS